MGKSYTVGTQNNRAPSDPLYRKMICLLFEVLTVLFTYYFRLQVENIYWLQNGKRSMQSSKTDPRVDWNQFPKDSYQKAGISGQTVQNKSNGQSYVQS